MIRRQGGASGVFGVARAVVFGAVVALVLAYALSYVLAHFGMGVVTASGEASRGPSVFARAALNLYAAQHVTLRGTSEADDSGPDGAPGVSAAVTLPLTVWALIPIVALVVGGCVAAVLKGDFGRRGTLLTAAIAGLLYGLCLFGAAFGVRADIDSFLIPQIGGFGANPPQIPFGPDPASALLLGVGFGVVFSCLGGLVAVRLCEWDRQPRGWWAATKAAVAFALAVQLLIAVAAGVWLGSESREEDSEEGSSRVMEMLPTVSGLAYSMIHGGSIVSGVESRVGWGSAPTRSFHARVSLYQGLDVEQLGRRSQRPISRSIAAGVAAIVAVCMFGAGWFAVKWGSRGGSLPTAGALAAAHTVYMVAATSVCDLVLVQGDPISTSAIYIRPVFGVWVVISFLGVFLLAAVGAHLANRAYLRVRW